MRYQFIKEHCSKFRVQKICRILKVSRSAYYRWLISPESDKKKEDERLLKKIIKIHEKSWRTYGVGRITRQLRKEGEKCGTHRVARIMEENGIYSCHRRKYKATTNSKHSIPVAPNMLAQDFTATKHNQKWVGDITYIPTEEGWLYFAGVEDLFNRKVVGWAFSERITKELTITAIEQAIGRAKPERGLIFHSDRGVQYAAYAYQDVLRDNGIRQSMSRKGNCYDNACMESFFATLKKDLVYRYKFKTRSEAKLKIIEYIETFYNSYRMHSSLGYQSPKDYADNHARNAA
jgi:putative transposase